MPEQLRVKDDPIGKTSEMVCNGWQK